MLLTNNNGDRRARELETDTMFSKHQGPIAVESHEKQTEVGTREEAVTEGTISVVGSLSDQNHYQRLKLPSIDG